MTLKKLKPTTPGQRGTILVDKSDLWSGKPMKSLLSKITSSGGRNNQGRITKVRSFSKSKKRTSKK